jgi:hypothetical protein
LVNEVTTLFEYYNLVVCLQCEVVETIYSVV